MTELRVDTDALLHNLRTVRAAAPDAQIIPVLKGNGYGLGDIAAARLFAENDVRLIAVSRVEEAARLAEAEIAGLEILLLSPYNGTRDAAQIAALGVTATVDSVQGAVRLNGFAQEAGKILPVHLKFDTGMGRFGFLPQQAAEAADALLVCSNLRVTGVFTHLNGAFREKNKSVFCAARCFDEILETLKERGIDTGLTHICNSGGCLLYPQLQKNAVRIGSALVGRLPFPNIWGLRPVAQLVSEIIDVRTLPAGAAIGYSGAYRTKRAAEIAVVPVGHADGLFLERTRDSFRFSDHLRYFYRCARLLVKKQPLCCVVRDRRVHLVGHVGLTAVTLDVTGLDCVPGDEVRFDVNPLLVQNHVTRRYVGG
jgi:alanine racemase